MFKTQPNKFLSNLSCTGPALSRDSEQISSRGPIQPELLHNSMKALCGISCAERNYSKDKRNPELLSFIIF